MAQAVQRDARQGGRPDVALELLAHAIGDERTAVFLDKDIARVAPGFSPVGLLVCLAGGVGPQGGQGGRVESDLAPALGRLGITDDDRTVDRHQGLADGDRAAIHVDILPAQPQRLAAAQAGRGQQTPQAKETIVSDVREEGDQLLARPSRQIAAFAAPLGRIGGAGRVEGEASPAHGVATGAVHGGVDTAHGGGGEATGAVAASLFKQPAVEGVERRGRQAGELQWPSSGTM